jgi:UDP-N-acetylglucosamine--N-acetylmuramyl-(pentapeptide) pyrophosphoryl-undecaprenol N-acetylglucosamine transferase
MPLKQKHNQLRIIIAGGGTGGHIFPAIAVAQAIQVLAPTAAILFVGALGKMEMDKIPKAGYAIKGITIAGYNRSNLFKNILLPWKLLKSFFQVIAIFKSFKPNAVFGVGGYSSFPVLKYAQTKGVPTFLHESNAFAGKANIWLAKNATQVFTGTKGMEVFFPAAKILVTGNPIRKNILQHEFTKASALKEFGLSPTMKTVLIVGGSLGANSINQVIGNNVINFFEKKIQLIWQIGNLDVSGYYRAAQGFENIFVSSFIDNMSAAYCAADVVISRSGAMAVAEICTTSKACIFVPYPFAAEDHQTFNAMALVNQQAALIVKDKEVNEKLLPNLFSLLENEEAIKNMEIKANSFALLNADVIIAEQILKNSHY